MSYPQKDNLPPTLGGFTFKGEHSSEYGVRQTPNSVILSPSKRRKIVQIPGRSSAVLVEDGGYDPRVETFKCSYVRQDGVSLQRQVRLIAGWLDGVGELTFDYEPEMHYTAFLSSPPPLVKELEYATFDLTFTVIDPFAYEDPQEVTGVINSSSDKITIPVEGTVKTPVKITITNTGVTNITNLIFRLRKIT